ncbi:MAG: hypothetical protein RLZZ24_1608 [Pseudomonadota bacterium]|jgi:hypothetical protein
MSKFTDHPWIQRSRLAVRTFANDVAQGFFAITHNGMAVMGLSLFIFLMALSVRPDLRTLTEAKLISWLQERQFDELGIETDADAVDRATATDPRDLPKQQANLAYWLSRKYRVAPEPLSALITEAYDVGPNNNIDPTLILAVMAVESGFNPFAQSHVGAQGLMQVMTKVHSDKYQGFGGTLAAFDPVANLRVGVNVLRDCIQRGGGVEGGLKLYVGAGNAKDDSGYAHKVLNEQKRLQQVAKGVKVPITTEPTSAAEAASQRLESLWEKAQRLSPFGRDSDKDDE